jgi:hypothetical protein
MEGSGYIDVIVLPTTGTYTIVVDPVTYVVGSLTLTLYNVPADVTGTATINGAAVPISLTVPGQKALLTFTGAASQSARSTVTVTSGAFGCSWSVTLKRGATTLATATGCGSSLTAGPVTLPASDTYTVIIDPAAQSTGSANVTVISP